MSNAYTHIHIHHKNVHTQVELDELMREKGSDGVVTKSDVEVIISKLQGGGAR